MIHVQNRNFISLTRLLLAILFLGANSPLHASAEALKIPKKVDQALLRSLDLLYNLNYEEAVAELETIQEHAEEHPVVAFALASAHWWRLSVFVLEPDPKESMPFLKSVDRCIDVSEKKIKKGDPTGEAHLALGGVLGLWGRWEATNRNWLSAYFKGKRAIRYLKRTLEINPGVKDAYMGLGIFDYYVATLPAVVRVLAFLGMGADKEKGIQELMTAASESAYAKIPSKLFLIDIYANQENNPQKAIEILDSMREEQPNSPFVHFLYIISYYNFNNMEALKESGDLFLKNLNEGIYNDKARTLSFFCAGLAKFKQESWDEAISYFNQAIQVGNTKEAFYTWSYLFKGYSHDALEETDEADIQYNKVLKQLRRWSSHDNARRALRNPKESIAAQLKKLQL